MVGWHIISLQKISILADFLDLLTCTDLNSLQTSGKHLVNISVYELDGEAFEGVSMRHCPSYCLLKLFITG